MTHMNKLSEKLREEYSKHIKYKHKEGERGKGLLSLGKEMNGGQYG